MSLCNEILKRDSKNVVVVGKWSLIGGGRYFRLGFLSGSIYFSRTYKFLKTFLRYLKFQPKFSLLFHYKRVGPYIKVPPSVKICPIRNPNSINIIPTQISLPDYGF